MTSSFFSDSEPRKKKYAKEAWPGKKPTAHLLLWYIIIIFIAAILPKYAECVYRGIYNVHLKAGIINEVLNLVRDFLKWCMYLWEWSGASPHPLLGPSPSLHHSGSGVTHDCTIILLWGLFVPTSPFIWWNDFCTCLYRAHMYGKQTSL